MGTGQAFEPQSGETLLERFPLFCVVLKYNLMRLP